jgi:hypothetical protein
MPSAFEDGSYRCSRRPAYSQVAILQDFSVRANLQRDLWTVVYMPRIQISLLILREKVSESLSLHRSQGLMLRDRVVNGAFRDLPEKRALPCPIGTLMIHVLCIASVDRGSAHCSRAVL